MDVLVCKCCGAQGLKKQGRYFICEYCDSKFLPENKMGESDIAIDDDVARLLAKCKSDPKNARKYANLVLDIDPGNFEAYKYL